jgi:hypothetical protein
MRSRLHEMCDFLELRGADFRFAPANATDKELLALAEMAKDKGSRGVGAVRPSPARAQLRAAPAELKWPGGRAGT